MGWSGQDRIKTESTSHQPASIDPLFPRQSTSNADPMISRRDLRNGGYNLGDAESMASRRDFINGSDTLGKNN